MYDREEDGYHRLPDTPEARDDVTETPISYARASETSALPQRRKVLIITASVVAALGGIKLFSIAKKFIADYLGGSEDEPAPHDNPNPPVPPLPPCEQPSLTYVATNLGSAATKFCLQNNEIGEYGGAFISKIRFSSNGNPPAIPQTEWISGALMDGAANVSVASLADGQNVFTIPYPRVHVLKSSRQHCLIALYNNTQPTTIPDELLQIPARVYAWDQKGVHAVPLRNDSCVIVPQTAYSFSKNNRLEQSWLNDIFSIMPNELYEAFKSAAMKGCLYAFLAQLTKDFLAYYLSSRNYSSKDIYYLTQCIKIATLAIQCGWLAQENWLAAGITLGTSIGVEAMPHLGAPKIVADIVSTGVGLAINTASYTTKAAILSGSLAGGFFARTIVYASKKVGHAMSDYFDDQENNIVISNSKV